MPNDILPILELDELAEIFDYPNTRQARRAIKAGTFPVPVFKMGNRLVAHVDAIEVFFTEQRDASMTWLKNKYGIKPDNTTIPTNPRLDLYRRVGNSEQIINPDSE